MATKSFYGQFIKAIPNKFKEGENLLMFKIIKNKGYDFKIFNLGEEGNEQKFTTIKDKLFADFQLEPQNIYLIWIEQEDEYLSHKYIKRLGVKTVSEKKEKSLMIKYNKEHPPQNPEDYKLSTYVVEESDNEEEPKPKKKLRKRKRND